MPRPKPQPKPKPPEVLLKFRVVNPQDEGLAGAQFTLYNIINQGEENEDYKVCKVVVSGSDGTVDFGCIPLVNFVMRQTSTPEDYAENDHLYQVFANCDGVLLDGFPGPHTVVNLPIGHCEQLPQARPRHCHNVPIRNPRQVFDQLSTDGVKYVMEGAGSLPEDFQRPNLLSPTSKWFCHIQGFGQYYDNLIVSHNASKNSRYGYFVVSKEGKRLGHHYDAYYENPGDDRKFNHTGGFQTIGDYLVIGIETPDYENSIIALYDIKDLNPSCGESSAGPRYVKLLRGPHPQNCLAVGITDFKITRDGVTKNYFLMITHETTGPEGSRFSCYLAQGDDITTADFHWRFTHRGGVNNYQGFSLLTEDIGTGQDHASIYIVAPYTTDVAGRPTTDRCDLWQLNLSGNFDGTPINNMQKIVSGMHFVTHSFTSVAGQNVHFRWGCSVEILGPDRIRLLVSERNFSRGKPFDMRYNTFTMR